MRNHRPPFKFSFVLCQQHFKVELQKFVGAERELRQSWQECCKSGEAYVSSTGRTDWLFNPPHGSHFGGIWEREIRTFRKVFQAVLFEQSLRLTGDSLLTLFCEVESIMNGRPLTPVSDDPFDLEALTPNHLLLGKGNSFPPGLFDSSDCYTRRRWRQVQYLADLFWKRWKREYLPLLQSRQKWQGQQRNISVGDLVLLIEPNSSRYQWPLGRVISTLQDDDGLVRSVQVRTRTGDYQRPIAKLVLLLEDGQDGDQQEKQDG